MLKNKIVLSVGLISLLNLGAQAQSFAPIGYKASSMGGAGVASSKNAMASYYNPALLAKPDSDVEVALGVGIGYVDNGVVESVNKLNDAGFSALLDKASTDYTSLTLADRAALINSKDIIIGMDGQGGLVTPDAYFSAQISSFSLGVIGSSEIAALAVVDQTRTQLIFDNGTGGGPTGYTDIETGQTGGYNFYTTNSLVYAVDPSAVDAADLSDPTTFLDVDTLSIAEVPLSYGHAFDTAIGDISLGGSFKFMQGTTYNGKVNIDTEFDDIEDRLKSTEKKTSTFGVDLGLLYEPEFSEGLRIGLVGKNLNKPEFDRVDGSKIEVDPMIRVGLAYDILDSLEFAIDYDISENDTLLASTTGVYKTQYIGGGLNWHPVSWASLRGGLMDNLSSSQEGTIYTAGLAVGPSFFQLDVSAQLSSKENTVEGDSYPASARVNIALVSRW